jgi:superfamily II DNA or RNA helicase
MKTAPGSERLEKRVVVKQSELVIPEQLGTRPAYHLLAELIITDKKRNEMIAKDTVAALFSGGTTLLISDRRGHLDILTTLIQQNSNAKASLQKLEIVRMDGEQSAKERKAILQTIASSIENKKPLIILATASLIGEGFDLAELDTLILAMPLSFKGRMIQYAGRLHRSAKDKNRVTIYDYLDSCSAMLLKMYRNRQKAYKTMGYLVEEI